PPEVQIKPADTEGGHPGGDKRHGDRHGDQQHHAGLACLQFSPTTPEERVATVDEDHGAQNGGDPTRPGKLRDGVTEQVGNHRTEEHDRYREDQTEPEPAFEHLGAVMLVSVVTAMAVMACMIVAAVTTVIIV